MGAIFNLGKELLHVESVRPLTDGPTSRLSMGDAAKAVIIAGVSSSPNCPKSTISPSSISGGRNSFKSMFAEARAEEKMSIGGMVEKEEVAAEDEEEEEEDDDDVRVGAAEETEVGATLFDRVADEVRPL